MFKLGLVTWSLEHSPLMRYQRVKSAYISHGFSIRTARSAKRESGGFLSDQKFLASMGLLALTPGPDELLFTPPIVYASMIDAQKGEGIFYDPGSISPSNLGMGIARYRKSTSSSMRSSRSGGPVSAKTASATRKPSRPTSSGQTSKPFWSSGKPKCKKGYRYDFRRKLCVKIR